MNTSFKTLRQVTVCAALACGLLAATAVSASAASFAPANDNYQATAATPITFSFQSDPWGIGPTSCPGSSFLGKLASPSSAFATVLVSGFGGCAPQGGSQGFTTTVTGGPSSLQALSTTSVRIDKGTFSLKTYLGDWLVCSMLINPAQTQVTGTWSNATHRVTFTNAPFNWIATANYFCPTAGGGGTSQGTGRLSGTYSLTNTTHPATPVTVQP